MYGNVLIVCKQLLSCPHAMVSYYWRCFTTPSALDDTPLIVWKKFTGCCPWKMFMYSFFRTVLWFEKYNDNSSAEDAVGELWIYYWSSMSYTFFIILIMTIIVVDNCQQSYKSLLLLGNHSKLIKCCVLVKNCCMDDVTTRPSYFCLLWGLVCVTSCNFKMNKLIKTVT